MGYRLDTTGKTWLGTTGRLCELLVRYNKWSLWVVVWIQQVNSIDRWLDATIRFC